MSNLKKLGIPDKVLEMPAKPNTCHNCGNTKNLEKRKSGPWTMAYFCPQCGFINYIMYSDKMGGNPNDTINLYIA
ncbi:MAG: hypothetical protein PHT07_15525 [Paludibacter sp.]|nr:hypothetical protein [Paludibacter sp.]